MTIKPSQRLSFRLMNLNDGELLFEVDQDARVMKFINGGKKSTMDDIQTVMLPRLQAYLNPKKGWGIWQVNVQQTQEYIGWVLVRPMDFFTDTPQFDNLELGWRFKAHTWGNGYATEAAHHVMMALSQDNSVKAFSAIAVPDNKASIKVMQKIGMDYIKTYTHKDPLGDWYVACYGMSAKNEKT